KMPHTRSTRGQPHTYLNNSSNGRLPGAAERRFGGETTQLFDEGLCMDVRADFGREPTIGNGQVGSAATLQIHESVPAGTVIGTSPQWRAVLKRASQVAATEATTCLQGESGTGKEVIARFIHRCSQRRRGPFIAINCAALPEQLL